MSSTVSALGSSQISSQISQVEARLQQPITQLQTQAATDKADISAWGAIQGAVSTLSNSIAGISNISTINNRSATSTTSTVATATATNTAQTGTYNLSNVTLAKMQEIYSSVQGSGSAKIGSAAGSLSFTLKNGKTENVAIGSSDMTLNGIAQAINKVAGGVQASVVGTSGGARLVLQSSATGGSQAFSVSGTGNLARFDYSSGTATSTNASGSMTLAQAASNASFNINGVPVSNTSNTISNALSGVSIALAASGSTTLSVSSSPGAIAGALSTVATNLNAAVAAIAKQTAYVPASSASGTTTTSAKAGPLLGNFTATDMSNQLLTAVTGAAASGMTSNAVGFSVSSTGAVTFSSATFSAAYAKNPTAVTALVNQIYKGLDTVTSGALGGTGSNGSAGTTGSIAAQTQSFQSDITSINSQVTQIEKNNNAQLEILVQEYSAAEAASTSAQTTQAYLSIFTSTGSSGG